MSERKKRNVIICSLCGVLLLMTIGYAAFNTLLNINGTTSITSNWDIKITNITSKAKEGNAYDIEAPAYTDLEATFKTGLKSPGDSITYDITVENKGTFNAYLGKITINKKDNPAIIFETSGLKENDELAPDDLKILTIKVTYNPDITEDPEDKSADFKVTLDFGQQILAQSELVWACPEGYTSSDEASLDMRCSKESEEEPTISCPSGCSVQSGVCSGSGSKSRPSCNSRCGYQNRYAIACGADYCVCMDEAFDPSPLSGCTCASGSLVVDQYNMYSCVTQCSESTTSYSCPSDYTKSGSGADTKCIKIEEASPQQVTQYTCPEGYTLKDKNKCYKE